MWSEMHGKWRKDRNKSNSDDKVRALSLQFHYSVMNIAWNTDLLLINIVQLVIQFRKGTNNKNWFMELSDPFMKECAATHPLNWVITITFFERDNCFIYCNCSDGHKSVWNNRQIFVLLFRRCWFFVSSKSLQIEFRTVPWSI